jgi:hypothetical protein
LNAIVGKRAKRRQDKQAMEPCSRQKAKNNGIENRRKDLLKSHFVGCDF